MTEGTPSSSGTAEQRRASSSAQERRQELILASLDRIAKMIEELKAKVDRL